MSETITIDGPVVYGVLAEIAAERRAQDAKWGEQNHPDGTGGTTMRLLADRKRARTQELAELDEVAWSDILAEEVYEAMAEDDPAKLRAELVQVAAVATAWMEAIDRRTEPPAPPASQPQAATVCAECGHPFGRAHPASGCEHITGGNGMGGLFLCGCEATR